MGEPAASPLLSSPTTPTTTRARKQPRQALSEADIPALPPADASQEEKARIMKERRRVQERIREQQRDRSARKRPSAAEDSARRAEDRVQEMALSMLTDARRLPLPRVDCVCDRTFNNLVNLTNTWLDAAEAESEPMGLLVSSRAQRLRARTSVASHPARPRAAERQDRRQRRYHGDVRHLVRPGGQR